LKQTLFSKQLISTLLFVFSFFSFSEIIFAGINEGLVAYYPFNGDANDISGNGNNGTVNGAVLTTDRYENFDSAFAFRADKKDYINVSNSSSLQIQDTVSISVWVCRTRIFGSDNSWDPMTSADIILEKGGDWTKGNTNYGISLHTWPSLNYMFYFYFTGGSHGVTGIHDFKWHHYVVVAKNNSNDTKIYIDGKLHPVEKNKEKKVKMVTSDLNLHIGAQISPPWNYYSANIIDEIRIYNRSLSEEEVLDLYHYNPVVECIDSDRDGVIDQWDNCPETPLNSYVNSHGCPLHDNSALSGRVLIKGQPLTQGNATLFQSGELFQKSPIDNNGWYKFENVSEEKSINIMIRKPVE